MPQATIRISPQPPSAGDTVTVTYTGSLPATLKVEIYPSGEIIDVSIDDTGSGSFTVPKGARSLVVSDPSGAATAVSTMVQ